MITLRDLIWAIFAALLGVVLVALFRPAVTMSNRCAGDESPPRGVRKPSLVQSALIVIITGLFGIAVEIFALMVIGGAASSVGRGAAMSAAISDYAPLILLSAPVFFLPVLAGMTAVVLSTSFDRGLLVALCYLIAAYGLSFVVVGILLLSSALL